MSFLQLPVTRTKHYVTGFDTFQNILKYFLGFGGQICTWQMTILRASIPNTAKLFSSLDPYYNVNTHTFRLALTQGLKIIRSITMGYSVFLNLKGHF